MIRPRPIAVLAMACLVVESCTAPRALPEVAPPGPGPARPVSARPSYASQLSDAFQAVSEEVGPAVVSVRSFARRSRRFASQQGSGVIVETRGDRGVVVTNNHVVKDSTAFRVYLTDGRDLEARLVGADPATDLAVLEVRASDLVHAELEQPDRLAVGEWVLAMGNPYGLGHTVTAGVVGGLGVSGLDIASYEDFVQTDAAINPGNSGGPLVNLEGRVVGINTAIGTESAGTVGIAYAIPSRIVRHVVRSLLTEGVVQRGWIGVRWGWLSSREGARVGFEGRSRVLFRSVYADGPAAGGGVREGDVLLALGGRQVTTQGEAETLVAEAVPGEPLAVQVWREGRVLDLTLRPVQRSEDRDGR